MILLFIVWMSGTVLWTVSPYEIVSIGTNFISRTRTYPARHAPALFSSHSTLLKIRELPEMMNAIEIANLYEPAKSVNVAS